MTNLRVNTDSRMMVYTETNRKGGDPSLLFEILEGAIEREDWLYLTDDSGQALGSFIKYIEAPYPIGCGMKPDKLLALLNVEHKYEADTDVGERMSTLRDTVKLMLYGELPARQPHGANQHTSGVRNTNSSNGHSQTAGDNLRRLKRDNPTLAQRVISGELTANAAAIEAGFRSPKVAVRLDDMRSAARTLASRLDVEQLAELITQLQAYRG